jgi:hypothetical protein
MIKALIVSLLLTASTAKADIQWPQINPSDAVISYSGGVGLAALYDVYQISTGANRDIWKTRRGYELAGPFIPFPIGEEIPYVSWKLGLGSLAGLAVELRAADRENRQLQWGNIGLGALGGLTSMVIHF